MPRPPTAGRVAPALGLFAGLLAAAGCGTTRMTDTSRSATEMLLISAAVDDAVSRIDFSALSGQLVYLDATPLDKDTVDRGYLVSLLRQQLLAQGALLQDERTKSVYVVEVRSGGIGTDRHSLLVGTPAVSLPSIVPAVPSANIPEIALLKKNDQRGVAKVGVFAYNRVTGRAVWQSGTVEATSRANDTWFLGTGPFSRGTIRGRTELAGEPLPSLPTLPAFPISVFGQAAGPAAERPAEQPAVSPVRPAVFPGSEVPGPPHPVPAALMGVVGTGAVTGRPVVW